MAKIPRTGELRHLVQWQSPNATQDSCGQLIPNWTNLATRYAKIEAQKSIEKLTEQPQAMNTYSVKQRFLASLDMSCRMLFGSNEYKVVGLLDIDGNGLWQEVTVVNTGLST